MKKTNCPFCGNEETYLYSHFYSSDEYEIAMKCSNCFALGPNVMVDLSEITLEDAAKMAQEAWENRNEKKDH